MKKRFTVTVNGTAYDVTVEEADATSAPVQTAPATAAAPAPKTAPAQAAPKKAVSAGGVPVKTPLQGTVMKINVKPGDAVKRGASVVVIEALKMENDVPAPQDGVVESIEVKCGDTVSTDQILLTLK